MGEWILNHSFSYDVEYSEQVLRIAHNQLLQLLLYVYILEPYVCLELSAHMLGPPRPRRPAAAGSPSGRGRARLPLHGRRGAVAASRRARGRAAGRRRGRVPEHGRGHARRRPPTTRSGRGAAPRPCARRQGSAPAAVAAPRRRTRGLAAAFSASAERARETVRYAAPLLKWARLMAGVAGLERKLARACDGDADVPLPRTYDRFDRDRATD